MNENVKKLTTALRSGKYKQIKKQLCNEAGYCCLGVACEVFMENGGELDKKSTDYRAMSFAEVKTGKIEVYKEFTYNGERTALPEEVRKWLGFHTYIGRFGDDVKDSLAYLNDNMDYDFNMIADVIEKETELYE
jgi:hypothetical protein